MSREIKFRAWDGINKKMLYMQESMGYNHPLFTDGNRYVSLGIIFFNNDFEKLLSTGLKDKNGKEIYEGDIYHLGDKKILSVVVWHDTGYKGKQIGTYGSYEGLAYWRDSLEVIGNRYEHPNLLGGVDK